MRPSTTSRRSCCARCSDTGPSLEPGVAVGCARLHGLGVEELVDGDEGVALLRELLQYLRDRLDGAPVDVVEEQNTALGGLLYGHVGHLAAVPALPVEGVHVPQHHGLGDTLVHALVQGTVGR